MPEAINLNDCLSPAALLFGQRLKHRRRELRLTQSNISEATGVAVGYISQIESGRANPTLVLVEKLALAVDMQAWAMIMPADVRGSGKDVLAEE